MDRGDGTVSIRCGKGTYLLDKDVSEGIRFQLTALQRQWEHTYGDKHAFGLATAVYTYLRGELPKPGDLLLHHNLDSKDLRRSNIAFTTFDQRCIINLKRIPKGTFNPASGVTRLSKGRYRARLQVPGTNTCLSLGIHPTRKEAKQARIRKYAQMRAELLLGPALPSPDA